MGFGSQRAPGRSEPFSGPSGGGPERDVSGRSKRESSINIRTCERRREHDAANDFKISSKDPRCPEVKVGVPKPTSGHQELHHEASSQDIAPSKISELENRIPRPTSGHQELVRDSRARRKRTKSRSENATTHMQRSTHRNHAKSLVFLGAHAH